MWVFYYSVINTSLTLLFHEMQWIKNTLTAEGIVVNQKKQKYNFKRDDFLKVVSSIWQTDHQKFIPGLTKVLILFALQLYLFTGARVGTFMPSDKDKHHKGLRYEVCMNRL